MRTLRTGQVAAAIVACMLCAVSAPMFAATLEPVSRTAASLPNDAGNARSAATTRALSADGCLAVFSSGATNIVAGQIDINGGEDVFLSDCSTGETVLLSRRAGTLATVANSGSTAPVISPDGRYVAFQSAADDLIDGLLKQHSESDLYLYDRSDDSLRLVNVSPNDPGATTERGAGAPTFSADSTVLVFGSAATDVLADTEDNNNGPDLFHHTLATGTTRLITRRASGMGFCIFQICAANGASGQPMLSADGRFVAFGSSASDLVTGQNDLPGNNDVFVWDRDNGPNGTSTLVSHAAGNPLQAVGERSENPTISADGAFVAYTSHATNLVAGQTDANADSDIFLFDRVLGSNTLASHLPGAPLTTDNDGWSGNPVLSPDGSLLVFSSVSQDLVAGQVDPSSLSDDLFVFERATGTNSLLTHAAGLPLTAGAGSATSAVFTSDGSAIVFVSRASNLVAGQIDGNAWGNGLMGEDIFRHELITGTTQLLSHVPGAPAQAGRYMSFIASTDAGGDHVFFVSDADNLTSAADGNDERDVHLWRAVDDTVTLVSARHPAADPVGMIGATEAVVSADGRWVAFTSEARNVYPGLVDDDTANSNLDRDDDIFLLDRETGEYLLVSRSAAGQDVTGNNDSRRPRISGDGRYVVFESAASNMVAGQVDGNGAYDIFLFDRADRSVVMLSHLAGNAAQAGNAASHGAEIARDGSHVVFNSTASNLIAGGTDGNTASDVFLFDIAAASLRLVSRSSGSDTTAGNGDARAATISSDGRFVAYQSNATNHVAGVLDFNGGSDVFLFDRDAGGNPNVLVSRADSGNFAGSAASRAPRLSADGNIVTYLSDANDLIPFFSDGNGGSDAFRFDRTAIFNATSLVSHVPGSDSESGDAPVSQLATSDDGSRIAFISSATNLAEGQNDSPFSDDLFLFSSDAGQVSLISQSVYAPGVAVGAELAYITGDGTAVLFDSRSWEIAEGLASAESEIKVYLHLVDAATSVLLSRSVRGPEFPSAQYAQAAGITPDGAVSLFLSPSSDIVTFDGNRAFDGQFGMDAYVFERALGIPTVAGPPDQVVDEDENTGALAFTLGDPDGDVDDLIVTGRSTDQTLVPNGNIVISGSGAERTVSVQPATEQSGTTTITLRATDGDGNVGIAQFQLDVIAVNDAPQVLLPGPTVVLEGQSTPLLDFQVGDSDHPLDKLLLSVESSNTAIVPTSGIALAGSGGNRRIRVTPAPDAFGEVTITVRAEDPDGAVGTSDWLVTVENINDAPAFTAGGDVTSDEDEVSTIAGWATAISAGPFEEAQVVAFEFVANSNPALFTSGPHVDASGTLSFIPAENASGTATLSVRMRDDGGVANGGDDSSEPQSFTIQIEPVNDLPTVTGVALLQLDEDGEAVYTFTVGDVEDDAADLVVSVASSDPDLLPLSGLEPGGSDTARTLAVRPAADAFGTAFVELTVSDSEGGESVLVVEVAVNQVDEVVDLVATLDNGIDVIAVDSEVTWLATVSNVGDDTAYAVDVLDNAAAGMQDITWTCEGVDGAGCSAAAGTGALAVGVLLPPGSHVEIAVNARITQDAAPALTYAIEAAIGPDTEETTPEDNLAIDADAVGEPIFGDGFED